MNPEDMKEILDIDSTDRVLNFLIDLSCQVTELGKKYYITQDELLKVLDSMRGATEEFGTPY